MLVPKWQATRIDGTIINQGEGISSLDLCDPSKEIILREFRITLPPHLRKCKQCGRERAQDARSLVRVMLDPQKKLIYRRRVPFRLGARTGKRYKPMIHHVVLVGWQQQLTEFTDKGGNHPNVSMVSVIDEKTFEVFILDRFRKDVAAGSHPPQIHPQELEDGWQVVVNPDDPTTYIPVRSTTELLDAEEEAEKQERKLVKALVEGKDEG